MLIELDAPASELVEVRRLDLRVVPADIAPTKIVGDNDQNIWNGCGCGQIARNVTAAESAARFRTGKEILMGASEIVNKELSW